jgi:hypothetical protein
MIAAAAERPADRATVLTESRPTGSSSLEPLTALAFLPVP